MDVPHQGRSCPSSFTLLSDIQVWDQTWARAGVVNPNEKNVDLFRHSSLFCRTNDSIFAPPTFAL